jgi:hypothetical protein
LALAGFYKPSTILREFKIFQHNNGIINNF